MISSVSPSKLSGREAIPGMLGILRRPLAPVEPDHAVAGSLLKRYAVRHQLTANRVDDLVDSHRIEPLWLIARRPRPALQEGRCRNPFLVVRVRPHAGGIIERKSAVIARISAGVAIALILVSESNAMCRSSRPASSPGQTPAGKPMTPVTSRHLRFENESAYSLRLLM